jgi:hypothetical protein
MLRIRFSFDLLAAEPASRSKTEHLLPHFDWDDSAPTVFFLESRQVMAPQALAP